MDSMDWFEIGSDEVTTQVRALHCALRPGGKTLLRSAALLPHYIPAFQAEGFHARRVGERLPGKCIDRYVTASKYVNLGC